MSRIFAFIIIALVLIVAGATFLYNGVLTGEQTNELEHPASLNPDGPRADEAGEEHNRAAGQQHGDTKATAGARERVEAAARSREQARAAP